MTSEKEVQVATELAEILREKAGALPNGELRTLTVRFSNHCLLVAGRRHIELLSPEERERQGLEA